MPRRREEIGFQLVAVALLCGAVLRAARTAEPVAPLETSTSSGAPRGALRLVRRFVLPTAVSAAPLALADGTFLVGDSGGRIHRLDASGLDVGAVAFGAPIFGIASAPAGGFVVVAGHDLLFLDASFRVRARRPLEARSVARPAVAADGTAYVGTQDERMLAVSATGQRRWAHRARADLDASPALAPDGSLTFAGDDGRLFVVESDGRVRISVDVGAPVRGAVGVTRAGLVVLATMGPRPRVMAIDARTGTTRWVFDAPFTDGDDEGLSAGVAVDPSGRVYVAGDDERLRLLDADGRLLGTHPLPGGATSAPMLLADGTVAVATDGTELLVFRAIPP